MSEKLAAFITLYNEKAMSDVISASKRVAKSEEKLNRAVELWNTIKTETEKLGIVEKFTAAFPQPGGKVIITDGVNPNPNYIALFSYGEPLESSVKELTTLKGASAKLQNAKNSLAVATTLVSRKPEDHLAILSSAFVGALAKTSALGVNSLDDLLKAVFSNYEDFESVVMTEIDGVDTPSTINTSPQTYEVLKERFESGELIKKTGETSAGTSPINEPTPGTETTQTSPLNPEVEAVPETETGVTNTSAVTGSPVQLPPEVPAPPTEGGVTVNVEATPNQTANIPGASVINDAGFGLSQEKITVNTSPTGQSTTSNINIETEKVSEITTTKETVESQIQKVPTEGAAPTQTINESLGASADLNSQSIPGEKGGISAINDIQVKAVQKKFESGPLAELLKSAGVSLNSEKISEMLSTKEKEKINETSSSQATSTKQNISNEITKNESLGITKDQMKMPSSPITGVTSTPETMTGSEPSPKTMTGSETSPKTGTTQQTEPAPGQTAGAEGAPSAPSIGNLSELEARLARIEFLLSGPLEVKIIE